MAVLLFLDALKAVRDTQEERRVGTIVFRPDNRIGRGFTAEQQILRQDRGQPDFLSPRTGGMRYWPHTEAGLKRIAQRYAAEDEAEMARRVEAGFTTPTSAEAP